MMLRVIRLTAAGDRALRLLRSVRGMGATLVLAGSIPAPVLSATAAVALRGSAETMAGAANDEFSGQGNGSSVGSYVNRQAVDAQLADPTSPNSLRNHGRP